MTGLLFIVQVKKAGAIDRSAVGSAADTEGYPKPAVIAVILVCDAATNLT